MEVPPQNMHCHLKGLEKAGLVEIVDTRQVRGAVEEFYRAVADQFTCDEKMGEAPDAGVLGLDFVTEWIKLGRVAAQISDAPSVYHAAVLVVGCDPEEAKSFASETLTRVGEKFRGLRARRGRELRPGDSPPPHTAGQAAARGAPEPARQGAKGQGRHRLAVSAAPSHRAEDGNLPGVVGQDRQVVTVARDQVAGHAAHGAMEAAAQHFVLVGELGDLAPARVQHGEV